MAENKIVAEARNEFGKGAARRIRRDHKVPAVLYGHGQPPVHLTLPGHETQLALRQHNVLLTIEIDGTDELALPKQVQRDPIKGDLEHVDLILVRRGEKVHVDITVHVTGEAAPDSLVVLELLVGRRDRRGHPHPGELRGQRRGPAGRHPAARGGPAAARRRRAGRRSRPARSSTSRRRTTAEQLEAELDEAQAELGTEAAPEAVEETDEGAADDEAGDGGDAASSDRRSDAEGSDDRS